MTVNRLCELWDKSKVQLNDHRDACTFRDASLFIDLVRGCGMSSSAQRALEFFSSAEFCQIAKTDREQVTLSEAALDMLYRTTRVHCGVNLRRGHYRWDGIRLKGTA